MIEIRKLKQLIELMQKNDLSEIDLRDKDEQVTLKRAGQGGAMMPQVMQHAVPIAGEIPAAAEQPVAGSEPVEQVDPNLKHIVSPMVGTYYASPSPDADAFVKIGASVDTETVVCIIEAMKVFNEIKSEISGTIEKVLVSNGDVVEYGQPLFAVRVQ